MATESESSVGLAKGLVVDGRYRVVRVIDLGGTGVVHQVEHVGTGRKLALKTLIDPANEARLEQEARAASHLRNPHVVRIVDMGKAPEVGPYLVMELLEGTNLRALLDEAGQLPIELVANVGLQVCECLEEAHAAGIVHRDLKPGNIHLTPTFGSQYHVTVLDFGAVKLQGPELRSQISPQEELTRVGSTVGTPFYMSLEQLRGNASVDALSDVYSLSVVLYEMLAGTRPFQAESLGDLVYALVQTPPSPLASVRPDVPPGLADVIARGLSARREARPASAREVATALAPLGDGAHRQWLQGGGRPTPSAPSTPSAHNPALGAPASESAPDPSARAAGSAAVAEGGPSHPAPAGAPPANGVASAPAASAVAAPPAASPPAIPGPPPLGAPGPALASPGLSSLPLGSPPLGPPSSPRVAAPLPPPSHPGKVPPPTPSSPSAVGPLPRVGGPPRAPLRPPPGGAPGLRPPPRPEPPRPPAPTPGEHSALTRVPDLLATHGLRPPVATTAAVPEVASELPDLFDPTTTNEPTVEREDPPRKRQDTPTEMFVQEAHGAGPPTSEPLIRPPSPPEELADEASSTEPPPRPEPPRAAADDDNPTSVLDLDALKQAARHKAAASAGPATTPPPAMGAAPAPGGLPTDTMRLDVESLSGPMAIPSLTAEERANAVDPASAPRASLPFDPSQIGIAGGGPVAAPTPPGAAPGPIPVPSSGLSAAIAPPGEPGASAGGVTAAKGAKPAWQTDVDRGLASIGEATKEASTRFAGWFRTLSTSEQTAFVAGAVLGFLIVLMVFVLIVT